MIYYRVCTKAIEQKYYSPYTQQADVDCEKCNNQHADDGNDNGEVKKITINQSQYRWKNENKGMKLVDIMENITIVVFPIKPEKMVIV